MCSTYCLKRHHPRSFQAGFSKARENAREKGIKSVMRPLYTWLFNLCKLECISAGIKLIVEAVCEQEILGSALVALYLELLEC